VKTTLLSSRANAQDNAPLVVFFAGWGMDEKPFADFSASSAADGCDLLICCDYTTLDDFDERILTGREIRRTAAWSLGVWAASALFARHPALAAAPERIAYNGTPYPADDARGIPEATYDGTFAGLSPATLAAFERRMCRDPAVLANYAARRPARPLESLRAELASIRAAAKTTPIAPAFTHAIIGARDAIFPPANQHAAWSGLCPAQKICIQEIDAPHYSDAALRAIIAGGRA
jgi:Uncharacterized protein conserved in bacteria